MRTPDAPLTVRRADHFLTRLRGLLFAPPLPPGHGLLLVPCAAVHTAFMRYAIDVVFLDRGGRIRSIVPHLAPWRAASCRGTHQTLELAAGEAARLGLAAGQTLPDLVSMPCPERPAGSSPTGLRRARRAEPCRSKPHGATLTEFVVVVPTMLFLLLSLIQYGLLYHAKSQLNYATFEAARAGTVYNADPTAMRKAFTRAMTGYYGGGTTTSELAASHARAVADTASVRIEILSPTKESFDDYHSPALAKRMELRRRVIPNTNIEFLDCPSDRPGCSKEAIGNASGQTLHDANLLKLRITYGIPQNKQIPLAGSFMTRVLKFLNSADSDEFRAGLVAAGRIPVVTHTVMRMHSPAIENGNASIPGPGNEGKPVDPGPPPEQPILPKCPITDPACVPGEKPDPICDRSTDPTCLPPDEPPPDGECKPPPGWLDEILRP